MDPSGGYPNLGEGEYSKRPIPNFDILRQCTQHEISIFTMTNSNFPDPFELKVRILEIRVGRIFSGMHKDNRRRQRIRRSQRKRYRQNPDRIGPGIPRELGRQKQLQMVRRYVPPKCRPQRFPVARSKKFRLAAFAVRINGSDRMNDVARGQIVCACNFCFAGFTAM